MNCSRLSKRRRAVIYVRCVYTWGWVTYGDYFCYVWLVLWRRSVIWRAKTVLRNILKCPEQPKEEAPHDNILFRLVWFCFVLVCFDLIFLALFCFVLIWFSSLCFVLLLLFFLTRRTPPFLAFIWMIPLLALFLQIGIFHILSQDIPLCSINSVY